MHLEKLGKSVTADVMRIKKNYSLLQEAVRIAQEKIFIKNTEFVYIAASESFAQLVGRHSAAEVIGKTDFELFDDEKLAQLYRQEDEILIQNQPTEAPEVDSLSGIEALVEYEPSKILLVDAEGEPLGIFGIMLDDSQMLAHRHFLCEIRQKLELKDEDFYVAVVDLNTWSFVERKLNPQKSSGQLPKITVDEFLVRALKYIPPEEAEAFAFYNNFSAEYINSIYQSGRNQIVLEYLHCLQNGSRCWMQDIIDLRVNPLNSHLYAILTLHSVEEERQKELKLRQAVETDGLTGLLNRSYIKKRCEEYLAIEGADQEHTFIMIDADDFKEVNDTYGHQSGDEYLKQLAQIFKSSFRGEDIVGRLGGDEFVVFMKGTAAPGIVCKKAADILERVRAMKEKYPLVTPSISMGISCYPENGTTVEELYVNADQALYRAKSKGKGRFEFYG